MVKAKITIEIKIDGKLAGVIDDIENYPEPMDDYIRKEIIADIFHIIGDYKDEHDLN